MCLVCVWVWKLQNSGSLHRVMSHGDLSKEIEGAHAFPGWDLMGCIITFQANMKRHDSASERRNNAFGWA